MKEKILILVVGVALGGLLIYLLNDSTEKLKSLQEENKALLEEIRLADTQIIAYDSDKVKLAQTHTIKLDEIDSLTRDSIIARFNREF